MQLQFIHLVAQHLAQCVKRYFNPNDANLEHLSAGGAIGRYSVSFELYDRPSLRSIQILAQVLQSQLVTSRSSSGSNFNENVVFA